MGKRERVVTQGKRERTLKLKKLRVRRRNVLLLAVGMFIANAAFGMAYPYLGVYMRDIGATMFMVGLMSVVFNATSTVFQYPFGYLSDKTMDRKSFISFGVLSTGLIYGGVALVSTPMAVLGLRTLQGVLGSAMTPAHSAIIAELSTKVGSGYGLFNSIENAGFMVGNFMGSAIVERLGIKSVFLVAMGMLITSAVIVMFIQERKRVRFSIQRPMVVREGRASLLARMKGSAFFRLMRGNLGVFYVTVLLVMIASGQFYSVAPVYFGETFGKAWVGIILGVESLAAALTGYFIGKLIDRHGAKLFYMVAIAGYCVAFLLYALIRSPIFILGVAFLSGVKWVMTLNSSSAYVAERLRHDERAQGMGLLNTMMSLGWVVGPLLGGYLSGISFELNFMSTLVPLGLALLLTVRLPG